MKDCSLISECRLCKSIFLNQVLDFGNVPLANSYPDTEKSKEDEYPLTIMKCQSCGHVQLRETINPDVLFAKYSYASSDSPALLKHFHEFACTVTNRLKLSDSHAILEIGCNDGILLREFSNLGYTNLYGVEPASNMAERAIGNGAVILNQFFNAVTAKKIKNMHGKMDVICANNVFAHVADIDGMTKGVVDLLNLDGVFVFENAYLLDTIENLYFDQCYHEHLQYYGIKPLMKYLDSFGLEIFHIQHVDTQGGSFRIFAKRKESMKWEVGPTVQEWVDREEKAQLYSDTTYKNFKLKLDRLAAEIKAFVDIARRENKTISCYGCPAKFALFSKVFGLTARDIQYVVDDSPLKFGRFSPGKKIPIVNGVYFLNHPTDYCIIAVWNMVDAVIRRNPEYPGKWIRPMPKFEVI